MVQTDIKEGQLVRVRNHRWLVGEVTPFYNHDQPPSPMFPSPIQPWNSFLKPRPPL